jgi:geranylgeranyl diphosphate synthase type II
VLEIFRQKTAPAFEVALRLGAILGGADEKVEQILHDYSEALGIAYQIRDDLADTSAEESEESQSKALQPSLLMAIAYENNILGQPEIERMTQQLLESFKNQAIRSLTTLENANLKGLLRRVVSKIFYDVEVMGCCDDYQARNAHRGQESKKSAR